MLRDVKEIIKLFGAAFEVNQGIVLGCQQPVVTIHQSSLRYDPI